MKLQGSQTGKTQSDNKGSVPETPPRPAMDPEADADFCKRLGIQRKQVLPEKTEWDVWAPKLAARRPLNWWADRLDELCVTLPTSISEKDNCTKLDYVNTLWDHWSAMPAKKPGKTGKS